MAMAALDRARHAATHNSIAASPDLRALLALLASLGDGDPKPYADFIDALEKARTLSARNSNDVARGHALNAARIGILRDLGISESPELMDEVAAVLNNGRILVERGICTRIAVHSDLQSLFRRFAIEILDTGAMPPPTEIGPHGIAWIVRRLGQSRQLNQASWGFERRLTGPRGGLVQSAVTNVSTVWGRHWLPTRNQFSRCLIPFNSFAVAGARTPDLGRVSHWFEIASAEPASFAGVYRPTGKHPAFAILTAEPNAAFASIGVKAMPVILQPEDEARWLDGVQWGDVDDLIAALPSQLLREFSHICRAEEPPVAPL